MKAFLLLVSLPLASSFDVSKLSSDLQDASFKFHKSRKFFDTFSTSLLPTHPVSPSRGFVDSLNATAVPSSFDFRSLHPSCASPLTVFDQGSCGGCWALSSAAALSDRFCSQGVDVVLSPQDLLNCVGGDSRGCSGGFTEDAYDYVADEGLRTNACVPFLADDGFCQDGCEGGGDSKRYFTSSWAQYVKVDETAIQTEIFTYGSVSAVFEVFEDFFLYESGVYKHTTGAYAGLHAVTLQGWGGGDGEEEPYWIVKNSWGSDFGEDGGFFRIARGLDVNGCNFEGGITTARVQK